MPATIITPNVAALITATSSARCTREPQTPLEAGILIVVLILCAVAVAYVSFQLVKIKIEDIRERKYRHKP